LLLDVKWSLPPTGSIPPLVERMPRILVLDGVLGVSARLRCALARTSCELTARSGADRVTRLLEEVDPDLLLVDLSLADPTGFEVCSELRATDAGRAVPIIIASTVPVDETQVTRGLMCGADDFLVIDDRVGEIQARLRVHLRNKRERDRLTRLRTERDAYRREAEVDALTGIPNRRAINATLERLLGGQWQFGVLFFDVDHFKSVNDTFGHDVGDHVLRAVAATIESSLGPEDHIGRFGGEEFVVVVPGADREVAMAAAERFRAAVARLDMPELGRRITVSVGVAVADPEHPEASVQALVARADGALYTAKRDGRNRVRLADVVGDASLDEASTVRVSALPESREATVEAALLRELASERAGLPLLPEAAAEALRLAEDPRTSMAHIAQLVERDPPLAARFIAIANSAAYSRGPKIASMQVALVRVGLAASRDLLFQVVYERSNRELSSYQTEVARSFDHSVRAAIAARAVAHELTKPCENAYLCGLLHDIGEARIYRILAKLPKAPPAGTFVNDLVAAHHCRAGAEVALAWRLPRDIADVCLHHHGADDSSVPAVQVVRAAEALVRSLENGPFNPLAPLAAVSAADVEKVRKSGVHPDRIGRLLVEIESQIAIHRESSVTFERNAK